MGFIKRGKRKYLYLALAVTILLSGLTGCLGDPYTEDFYSSGDIHADKFYGDGSNLTGISSSVFTNLQNGLVPAPNGDTGYLKNDGTWDSPSGTGDMAKATYDSNNNGVIEGAQLGLTTSTASTLGAGFVKTDGTGHLALDNTVYLDHEDDSVVGAVNGIVKANGLGNISAASSGTDYAPATSGSAILKGNGLGGFSSASSGTDYAPASSGSSVLKGNGSGGFSSAAISDVDPLITRIVEIKLIDDASSLTTGDGKVFFCIPIDLNGWNLIDADAMVSTVSTSGLPTYMVYNVTDSSDMLTVGITIDENENTSYTAATGITIDASHDDVATGDILRIDKDVAGTGEKGDTLILRFSKP